MEPEDLRVDELVYATAVDNEYDDESLTVAFPRPITDLHITHSGGNCDHDTTTARQSPFLFVGFIDMDDDHVDDKTTSVENIPNVALEEVSPSSSVTVVLDPAMPELGGGGGTVALTMGDMSKSMPLPSPPPPLGGSGGIGNGADTLESNTGDNAGAGADASSISGSGGGVNGGGSMSSEMAVETSGVNNNASPANINGTK